MWSLKVKLTWLAQAIKPVAGAMALFMNSASLYAETVNALPDPQCRLDINLSATPSIVDREAEAGPKTLVSWSVKPSAVKPNPCHGEFIVSLDNHPVDFEDEQEFQVLRAKTFDLKVKMQEGAVKSLTRDVAVSVLNDPGTIEISDGSVVTDKDLEEFDKRWMQPWSRNAIKGELGGYLHDRIFWWGSEWMEAMVRMYDLTKEKQFDLATQKKYVNHLKELNEIALSKRDDKHPESNGVLPVDEFRGNVVLPGWGGRVAEYGNKYSVSELTFAFIHSFSAFGRIVAENSSLQPEYGSQAINMINEAIKSARIFLPQLNTREVNGKKETAIKTLDIRSVLTKPDCDQAYRDGLAKIDADPGMTSGDKSKAKKWQANLHRDCLYNLKIGGILMAHNWNQWFTMGLIELWRAMDSAYYRNSANADPRAADLRNQLPLFISRLNRYFVNRMRVEHDEFSDKPVMVWNYNDDLPSLIHTYIEDTSHGSLDLRGMEVLRRNFAALNQAASALGEPIQIPVNYPSLIKNTFLYRIALTNNNNLADNMGKHYFIDPLDMQPHLNHYPN